MGSPCPPWSPWSPWFKHFLVTDRGSTFLPRQLVFREAGQPEAFDQFVIAVIRYGVRHGLAGHRRGLEAPGSPARIEVASLDGPFALHRCEILRHRRLSRPLAVDVLVRGGRGQLPH